jgi:hypothetical protein
MVYSFTSIIIEAFVIRPITRIGNPWADNSLTKTRPIGLVPPVINIVMAIFPEASPPE